MTGQGTRAAYVVDDEAAIRRSLTLLLRSAGFTVQAFESGDMFLRAAVQGLPFGCVLLDLRMPGMDGLTLQHALSKHGVRLPVVIVTAHGDVPLAVQAMKGGACDFVEKPYTAEAILQATEAALGRDDEEQARTRERAEAAARVGALSPREREVVLGLVAGHPHKVIAYDLGLSPRTVEIHRANAMTKLGASSLAEAVRITLTAGLESP